MTLLFSCKKNISPNWSKANRELQNYCKSNTCSINDFNPPTKHKEKKYDYSIEYITKKNITPKHVLILYFIDNEIVEQHRLIE